MSGSLLLVFWEDDGKVLIRDVWPGWCGGSCCGGRGGAELVLG